MAGHKLKKGERIRAGKFAPYKVCVTCGESKPVAKFPKRGGHRYKSLKNLDPKKYDTQCKLCKKPVRPGQDRSELTEPKAPGRVAGAKAGHRTRKAKQRSERAKLTAAQYKQRIREETRCESMLYLSEQGCQECGERDPRVLEYDHKKPDEKHADISRLITDGYSWTSPKLRAEIGKCRVICANCHRLHTIKQQNYYDKRTVQETIGKLAARYKFSL